MEFNMTFSVWLAFAAASIAMGLIPGPGVIAIVGYALGSGRKTALASVAGMAVGNAIAMTLSLAGVGALLAASALAFSALKWAGALYLIGLGFHTISTSNQAFLTTRKADAISPRTAFLGNVAVGVFHPKTIVFYVSFVPQFISASGSYTLQAALLTATFCLIVAATDLAYALTASSASSLLSRANVAIWSKRASGGALICAGVATATAQP
jgi:threonine/homoserine/homoserine lactone efflux protein